MEKQKGKMSKRSKVRWGVAGILILLLVTTFFDAPAVANSAIGWVNNTIRIGLPTIPEKAFNLGLDLQGGAHLVYQADVSGIPESERTEAVDGVRDVIERRINGLGVGEPVIQASKVGDEHRVIVELPGVTDVNEAISLIGETPILEFKEEDNEPPRELTADEKEQIKTQNETASQQAQDVLSQIQSGELTFERAVSQYSEDTSTKEKDGYLGFLAQQPGPEENPLYQWAKTAQEDDVSDTVIETTNGYHVLKRGGEQEGDTYVTASHILLCYQGATGCTADEYATPEDAKSKAEEILAQATPENFADLAREYSTEPNASITGGALGDFPKGAMVPTFEDAVFSAGVGEIIGPVESEYGFHLIYKTKEEETREYEVSHVFIKKLTEADILPPSDGWKATKLSGKQLDRAEVVSDYNTGQIQVALNFDAEGKELFKDLTERNIGKQIAIFLDGQPVTAPVVNTIIPDGQAVITGGFTIDQAQEIAKRLNAGALPVPVELIAQKTVGASLGAVSLAQSLKAGVVALILVMIFMLLYYRLPGLLSIVALSLYLALTLAIFKLIGVTLTLAGIAGFILSIGMAVDANVLIFERLKEELRKGKSLKTAAEEGFVRAWSAIRDGNISTVITCILLIWFGSSFVQGFAFTLMIGVLISMFSAITITRVLLRFVAPWFGEHGNQLFLGYTKKKEESV